MDKFNSLNVLREYARNKPLMDAYFAGRSIEGFSTKEPSDKEGYKIMGLTLAAFAVVVLLSIALWVWGLVVLLMYWSIIPVWAQVIGILGLFFGFPLITVVLVYVGKAQQ